MTQESEDLSAATRDEYSCEAQTTGRPGDGALAYLCTRATHHSGRHAAHGGNNRVLHVWGDKDAEMATTEQWKAVDDFVRCYVDLEKAESVLCEAQRAVEQAVGYLKNARENLPGVGANIPRKVFPVGDGRLLIIEVGKEPAILKAEVR